MEKTASMDHPLAPRVTESMKAVVAEDDHRLLDASDHRMKDRIVDIDRVPILIDGPAPLIEMP